MEIGQFENLKSKKENNVKDIKNQVIHNKITSQLQKSEQQINLIENKLKDMTLNQQPSVQQIEEYIDYENYQRKEALLRNFAEMEEQTEQFDKDLINLLRVDPISTSPSHHQPLGVLDNEI